VPESIICSRSFEFTCRIIKLCERMWERGPGARAVAKQSRETRYWLRVAVACGIVTAQETEWELREVNELRAMIIAAIKTAQASSRRGDT